MKAYSVVTTAKLLRGLQEKEAEKRNLCIVGLEHLTAGLIEMKFT